MKKFHIAAVLFLLVFITGHAQTIENSINLFGDKLPAEKIHIHFDKEIYLPGETIWFKAYIFEENLPTTRSTNLYISLYDKYGKALQQNIYPIINATCEGHFEISDSIESAELICRAYTNWMLNFGDDLLFTKAIKLFNNKVYSDTVKKTVSLSFFPEGGDIIEGERNSIAFKANYNNGMPFNVNGIIKKQETGEVIFSFKSIHDGMGRFDIVQGPGEHYYAEWIDNYGKLNQTNLPLKKANGVLLKLVQQKGKLVYNVVNKMTTDTLHVLGYMYQKVIYKANLAMSYDERYTGSIPMENFPSGTMQLTVFDDHWQPVAERICFVSNNYMAKAHVIYRQISVQKRTKNSIEIIMPDTIPANLSLSVTDADFNNEEPTNNIITNLLLNGDLKGYIHNPAYYFSNPTDAGLKAELDLVMLTHGWRKYNWNYMLNTKTPVINFPPDNYLGIYGQVGEEAMKKIKKNESVNLLVKSKDSTSNFYLVQPDITGLLKASGLVFFDTAKIYYSFNTDKQYNKQMAFSTANYTLQQPRFISNYHDLLIKDSAGTVFNTTATLYKYYIEKKATIVLDKVKTLERVIIKSGGWHNWKNDPMLKMDEKYATGMFLSGANAFSFDLLHDEKARDKFDIYNYLSGKVPGLILAFPKGMSSGGAKMGTDRYFVYGPKLDFNSGTPSSTNVLIYVDEREIETSELETISLSQIAYIKFIPNFTGKGVEPGKSALNPAISIYLKKGNDLIDRTPQLTDLGMVMVPGYSPVKEFYVPDYSKTNDVIGNDFRTTLLWEPYIFTGKNSTTVPVSFYNNDFSKRVKIVLEGINDEGKLIHVEKIIE